MLPRSWCCLYFVWLCGFSPRCFMLSLTLLLALKLLFSVLFRNQITSLGEEGSGLYASRAFVCLSCMHYCVCVCFSSLLLGVMVSCGLCGSRERGGVYALLPVSKHLGPEMVRYRNVLTARFMVNSILGHFDLPQLAPFRWSIRSLVISHLYQIQINSTLFTFRIFSCKKR